MSKKKKVKARSEVFDELTQLREQRKQIKDREKRRLVAEQHAKVLAEFKSWKTYLKKLIDTRSKLEIAQDGKGTFILPAEIVKLVWKTTIEQRIAIEKSRGEVDVKEATKKAMHGLQEDISSLSDKFQQQLIQAEPLTPTESEPATN